MSIITFEDLKIDPSQKFYIELAEQKYGTPLPYEIQQIMLEINTKVVEQSEQRLRWTRLIYNITNKIISGKAVESDFPLFWIYLYGLLTEMLSDFDLYLRIGKIPDFIEPIYITASYIKSFFSDDEIRFIKFMRHNHVHLHLDYYWSKTTIQNGFIVKVKTPTEIDARDNAERIIKEHNNCQNQVAYDFARRINVKINLLFDQVTEAMKIV
ncbi:MAG: hypothetical protein WC602_03495 [archaeon]